MKFSLLSNDIQNNTLRETVKDINNDLKQGRDSEQAFLKHERVFGKFTAHMLGLASKSGNMAEIYESSAKFLERQADFKKSIKSALIMPAITMFALLIAMIYYIAYIFPENCGAICQVGASAAHDRGNSKTEQLAYAQRLVDGGCFYCIFYFLRKIYFD